jgi:arginyl-tRNA synthetase
MATLTVGDLESLLGRLGMNLPVPEFPGVNIQNNPLDIVRSYLADILCGLTSCNRDVAFHSIQPASGIADGDVAIRLPIIKHTADYDEFGLDLKKKVR